uniref:Basic tail secreted protein n=1 Tax=Rhipicephalus appendiculatus TaxID=34631 RepID=A0A131Z671_RHIAP
MWCPAVAEPEYNQHIDLTASDPDDPYPCAKLWCPAVTQVRFNNYICLLQPDPDLLPTTTTTTTTTTTKKPEEPPTTPEATQEDQKPKVQIPPTRDEVQVGLRVPWVGYSSTDCWYSDGRQKPDGTPCLITPNREDLGYGNPCYHGVCKKGRCTNAIYSRCATM